VCWVHTTAWTLAHWRRVLRWRQALLRLRVVTKWRQAFWLSPAPGAVAQKKAAWRQQARCRRGWRCSRRAPMWRSRGSPGSVPILPSALALAVRRRAEPLLLALPMSVR